MRGRKLQSFERQLIREGFEAGRTLDEMARTFGLSVGTIRRVLGDSVPAERRRLTDHEKRLIERLADNGLSYRQIADEVGLDPRAVRKHLNRRGMIKTKRHSNKPKHENSHRIFTRMTQSEVDFVCEAFYAGQSIRQTSREIDRGSSTVGRLFQRIERERVYCQDKLRLGIHCVVPMELCLSPEQNERRLEIRRTLGIDRF